MPDSPETEAHYRPPYAPRGLQDGGKRLWQTVAREWQLEPDSEELELLRLAAQAQDQLDQAQRELDAAGSMTFLDRFDRPTERPEVRIIRQARSDVAALVKQIGEAQMRFRRLELAEERHAAIEAGRGQRRDRRGGGVRRIGR
jgi:phage terminase small subunit